MNEFPNTISEAAKLLDREVSGWANQIDVESLDMTEPERCILGQLFGNYANGRTSLFLHIPYNCHNDTIFGSKVNKASWILEINNRLNKKDAKQMNFTEALELLKADKKVRRKCWESTNYLRWQSPKLIADAGPAGLNELIIWSQADDWIEVKDTIKVRCGSRILICNDEYIVCRSGNSEYILVNLKDGNKWTDAKKFDTHAMSSYNGCGVSIEEFNSHNNMEEVTLIKF